MIVVDASVLANIVGDDGPAGDAARARLRAARAASVPDLADVETMVVLRRLWLTSELSLNRFREAVDDLIALAVVRYEVSRFMPRAFELRANVTPYDACYIALAESLQCTLVTADARLARAHGIRCDIEVLALS